ncbi:hypothetical protein [Sulfitobacter sp. 916]|uniref:hypothetical protein n=1 Tax=Sulfitobacter sp. 916 TaxID=3368559 RepID=UPI003748FE3E
MVYRASGGSTQIRRLQQRQIEAESRGLTKAERRTRERKGTLKGTNSAVSTTEGLRPIDTGDTSRPLFKVERW